MPELQKKSQADRDAAQDIAALERDLRALDAVEAVMMDVHDSSARLWFDTWEPNESSRGTAKTHAICALADSDHWQPVTLHDDIKQDGGLMSTGVSYKRTEVNDASSC